MSICKIKMYCLLHGTCKSEILQFALQTCLRWLTRTIETRQIISACNLLLLFINGYDVKKLK